MSLDIQTDHKRGDGKGNKIDHARASLGGYGRKFQEGAGILRPDNGKTFVAVQALDTSVITLADVSDLTLYAGAILYGRDASVSVVSGHVVAYQGV